MKELDHLKHYGILGMKWGIRRYQDYDGKYTKAGLERYKKTKSLYENAKLSGDKTAIRRTKNELRKEYKDLKNRKRIDEGRELVRQGKSITYNNKTVDTFAKIGKASAVGAGLAYNLIPKGQMFTNRILMGYDIRNTSTIALGASALAASGFSAILSYPIQKQNRQIRAYYNRSGLKN